MKNKGIVVFLTIIITLLCIYYLSFTFVSSQVKQDAKAYATAENGDVDYFKRDRYLDSISNEVVYDLGFVQYTFQEVQDTELNLGLDLQGGMHVTLEVSPVEIIKGLSGNNEDPKFLEAIELARQRQSNSQDKFLNLFYSAFQEVNPGVKLSTVFANASNRGRISFDSDDSEVLDLLDEEIESAIDRSFVIIRTRIDQFGTSQPNIQKLEATGRIQVELPGVDNKERVRKILQGVAKLEFWEVWNINEYSSALISANQFLLNEQKLKDAEAAGEDGETAAEDDGFASLLQDEQFDDADADTDSTEVNELEEQLENDSAATQEEIDSLIATQYSPLIALNRSQFGLQYELKDTAAINDIIKRPEVMAFFPSNLKFLWSVKADVLEDGTELIELHAIRKGRGGKAPLTGEVVTNASRGLDDRTQYAVFLNMNAQGAKTWKRLTGENIGRRIAIVLDNFVYSAPNVQTEIPNGSSIITGNFTDVEALDLANILKAGTLPAPTRIVEEAIVGPTLGKEAQVQGITSIIAGLAIVILFVIAYYSSAGFVANIALLFNIFFIIGILAQIGGAALTLPGIAGIVLTIGMSIDANVLIFERIREELRNGADLRPAIAKGYEKAFSSIIDSNVTTFLTGAILFIFGQGPVKGFAIVLMIGIGTSFLSAVYVTRVIVEWLAKKGNDSKISFKTPFSRGFLANMNFDFVSKRRIAYLCSAAFIALGVTLIVTNGLKMGVDFTGGRSYVVAFNDPVVSSDLKSQLTDDFQGAGTEVKTFGKNSVLKVTTSYLVADESTEADQTVETKTLPATSTWMMRKTLRKVSSAF